MQRATFWKPVAAKCARESADSFRSLEIKKFHEITTHDSIEVKKLNIFKPRKIFFRKSRNLYIRQVNWNWAAGIEALR